MSRRNRAMATAKGLTSTPAICSSVRRASSRTFRARLVAQPASEDPAEGAEQKVTGAARGIDQLHLPIPDFLHRPVESTIEDELLHELRRLQESETFAGAFGEILIQIAEKARVPLRIDKIVDQRAGARVRPCGRGSRSPARRLPRGRDGRSDCGVR